MKALIFTLDTIFIALIMYVSYYVFSAFFWMLLKTPWVMP